MQMVQKSSLCNRCCRKRRRLGTLSSEQIPLLFSPVNSIMFRSFFASVAIVSVSSAAVFAAEKADKPVSPVVSFKAESFDLKDVRLLDSPFKKAMDLDTAYLLKLDPKRLLYGFYKNAGIKPKGESYGGWEKETIAGHSLGHYLSACAMAYAATGDVRFKERTELIVKELTECQDALGTGFVGGMPEAKRVFDEVSAGNIRSQGFDLNGSWVPFYNLHKLFAGLDDTYRLCGVEQALTVQKRLADFIEKALSKLDDAQMQKVMACEHGGINESFANLYAATGDERYLALSRKFHHKDMLVPLAAGKDVLPRRHANTQVPKLVGLAARYELTGDKTDRAAAEFFWDRVAHHHSYVIGGNSDGEYFGDPDNLDHRLGENTCEVCNTNNMLKLTKHLFTWDADPAAADFYERAVLNHILASQNPKNGMMCYYVTLKPGSHKNYSDEFNSFWCCVGTGMENHVKYGDFIYFHKDDTLFVTQYIPSVLTWKEKGVTLRMEGGYPESGATTLLFACEKPTMLTVKLRVPAWAKGASLKVNGEKEPVKVEAGKSQFVEVKREWKSGDKIEFELPYELRTESMPDNANRAAVLYGPMVLAGELGAEDAPNAKDAMFVPVFVTEGKPLAEWLKPVADMSDTFRSTGAGRPRDVTLYPFYRMHEKRYSVYWNMFTPEQWAKKEVEYKAESERQKKLEEMTVDFAQPGQMQSERDHNVKSEKSYVGDNSGRHWRDARDGGFMSFEMKAVPDAKMNLHCTYWGGDTGNRTFDILADGVKVGTQVLKAEHPDKFFDGVYPLPAELTKGKTKITVRIQPAKGSMAGGVFGIRVVRAEEETKK